jgi:hypothetical protein
VSPGDVELKHLLWTLRQQWGTSTGAWLEAPFFELDVVDMTEQVRAACRCWLRAAAFGRLLSINLTMSAVRCMQLTLAVA